MVKYMDFRVCTFNQVDKRWQVGNLPIKAPTVFIKPDETDKKTQIKSQKNWTCINAVV